MSQRFIANGDRGGICRQCEHDLVAARDGRVYCSNPACVHRRRAHPTGKSLNRGRKAAA